MRNTIHTDIAFIFIDIFQPLYNMRTPIGTTILKHELFMPRSTNFRKTVIILVIITVLIVETNPILNCCVIFAVKSMGIIVQDCTGCINLNLCEKYFEKYLTCFKQNVFNILSLIPKFVKNNLVFVYGTLYILLLHLWFLEWVLRLCYTKHLSLFSSASALFLLFKNKHYITDITITLYSD